MLAVLLACREEPTPSGDDDDVEATGDTADPGPGPTGPEGPFSAIAWAEDPSFPSLVHVTWTQAEPATVHLEFEVDPGEWRRSPARELTEGDHEEFLVGVPYGARVPFRLVAEGAAAFTTAARTARAGDRPRSLEEPSVRVNDDPDPDVPYVLLSVTPDGDFGGRWWAMIVDRQGRAVWGRQADPSRMTMHPRLTWDEDALLLDQNSFWANFDRGVGSTILRTTLEGRETHVFTTPGLHHPFGPLPDGGVAYGAIDERTHDEDLVLVDPDTDARTPIFECQPWLASQRLDDDGYYCASNTVNYDAVTDTFLFSFYSFETILEIDGPTHAVARWFGHLPGSWTFDPPSSAFWWQHGGHYLPNGNLITSSHDADSGTEILVREYALDDASNTLRNVFSMDDGDGLWGFERNQMGEVARLPNGNTLHNLGTYARIREGTPDGRVVWDVEFATHDDLGRTTPVRDLYALLAPRR